MRAAMPWGRRSVRVGIAAIGLLALGATAQEPLPGIPGGPVDPSAGAMNSFSVRLGSGRSDNIRRHATVEESASYTLLGFNLARNRETRRLTADVVADLERRAYSGAGIEDEPYGTMNASLELHAVPDRVAWVFEDNFGQGRVDAFEVDAPQNRDHINVFSTGPRVTIPIGGRTGIVAQALYEDTSYGDSAFLENDAVAAELALVRALSTTAQFRVTVSRRDTEFDLPGLGYDLNQAYVTYQRELATGAASFSVGTSEADFGVTDSSAPYLDATWQREVGARSRLSVGLANQLIDAAENLDGRGIAVPGASIADDFFLTADVYEQASAAIALTTTWARSQLSLSVATMEADYESTPVLSNDRNQLGVRYERTLGAPWIVGLDVYVSDRTFDLTGQQDDDESVHVRLLRTFGRGFSLEFSHQLNSREGAAENRYDEDVSRIVFTYTPNPAR